MEKVTTQDKPAICELGINGVKTFNIGITKVRNKEEYTCYSASFYQPALEDVVPVYISEGISFSQKEVEAIKENCNDNGTSKLITAIVRSKYSADDVEAIILNQGDGVERHQTQLEELQAWRKVAKETAKLFEDATA